MARKARESSVISMIDECLEGLDFPATKEDILNCAEGCQASDDVLDALDSLPEGEYNNMAEIIRDVSATPEQHQSQEEEEEDDERM